MFSCRSLLTVLYCSEINVPIPCVCARACVLERDREREREVAVGGQCCSSTRRLQAPTLGRRRVKFAAAGHGRSGSGSPCAPARCRMLRRADGQADMSSACESYHSKENVLVAAFTCPKADSDATALFCCGFSDLKYCCDDPNSFFPYEYGYMWWLR